MQRKRQVFLVASIFGIIGIVLCVRLYQTRPVVFLGTGWSGNYEDRILQTLNGGDSDAVSAPSGFERPIADLKPKEGGTVEILVLEGEFTDEAVNPKDRWKKYLHGGNYVLVNSVDERQDTETLKSTISYFIGQGCGLQPYVGEILNLGDVKIHNCDEKARYSKLFGPGNVANAAIVVSDSGNNGHPACWHSPNSEQYRDCMRRAIGTSFEDLFGPNHYDELGESTIVMPALGTGFGHLGKDAFYKELFLHLRGALYERPRPWNTTIVLQVYRGTRDWKETKSAIARNLGELAEVWKKDGPDANTSEVFFMAGISLSIASIFLFSAFFPGIASTVSPRFLFSRAPVPISVGWFAASAGLMVVLKQVGMLLGHLPGWVYGVGGALSIILCVPVIKAMTDFNKYAGGE